MGKKDQVNLNITVGVLPLDDDTYIAVTKIGGATLRGQVARSRVSAVRALFGDMGSTTGQMSSGQTGVDTEVALAMALNGGNLEGAGDAIAALPDSSASSGKGRGALGGGTDE